MSRWFVGLVVFVVSAGAGAAPAAEDDVKQRFELATVYTAAVTANARQAEAAARFIALLTSPAQREQRERCGLTEP